MKCPKCTASAEKSEKQKLPSGEVRYTCNVCGARFETVVGHRMFPKGILIFMLCGFIFGLLPSVPYALLMAVTAIVIFAWARRPVALSATAETGSNKNA